jgi:hypothetical protein
MGREHLACSRSMCARATRFCSSFDEYGPAILRPVGPLPVSSVGSCATEKKPSEDRICDRSDDAHRLGVSRPSRADELVRPAAEPPASGRVLTPLTCSRWLRFPEKHPPASTAVDVHRSPRFIDGSSHGRIDARTRRRRSSTTMSRDEPETRSRCARRLGWGFMLKSIIIGWFSIIPDFSLC